MSDLWVWGLLGGLNTLCWFGLGWWSGWISSRNAWRDEMIKRGHARFHWENARWYWVEDLPPPPPDPAARAAEASAAKLEKEQAKRVRFGAL